ncbi:MAG: YDG domain-containing protein, partial [Oscillospiraceae bacterium]|nr:YDG domain-containing protein [Oscillospiraceae bacterium]
MEKINLSPHTAVSADLHTKRRHDKEEEKRRERLWLLLILLLLFGFGIVVFVLKPWQNQSVTAYAGNGGNPDSEQSAGILLNGEDSDNTNDSDNNNSPTSNLTPAEGTSGGNSGYDYSVPPNNALSKTGAPPNLSKVPPSASSHNADMTVPPQLPPVVTPPSTTPPRNAAVAPPVTVSSVKTKPAETTSAPVSTAPTGTSPNPASSATTATTRNISFTSRTVSRSTTTTATTKASVIPTTTTTAYYYWGGGGGGYVPPVSPSVTPPASTPATTPAPPVQSPQSPLILREDGNPIDETVSHEYGSTLWINTDVTGGSDTGGAITYASSNEAVATVGTDGAVVFNSAGTAVITATKAGNAAYYSVTSNDLTVIVTERDVNTRLTVTPPAFLVYNGLPHIITVEDDPWLNSADDLEITYRRIEDAAGNAIIPVNGDNINAGTIEYTITAKTGGNYAGTITDTFVITQKDIDDGDVSVSVSGTFTFNNTPHAPVPAVSVSAPMQITETQDYTISYGNNTNASNTASNLSSASVTLNAAADGNYFGSISIPFTIQQAVVFGTPAAIHVTYPAHPASFALSDISLPTEYSWSTPATAVNTGDGQTFAAIRTPVDDNYAVTAGTITVNVAKGTRPFPAAGPLTTTFTPALKLSDVPLPANYEWAAPSTPLSVANDGDAFPAVYTDPSGNYLPASGTVVVNINQATGTFPAHSVINETYTPTLKLSDLPLSGDYAWVDAPATSLNAGNGQSFNVIYTHPSGNYAPETGTVTVNIAKADQTPLPISNMTKTYGDDVFPLINPALLDPSMGGALTHVVNPTEIISFNNTTGEVTINHAGTEVLTVTRAGNANYNDVSETISILVEKRDINEAYFEFDDLVYNGLARTPVPVVHTDEVTHSTGLRELLDNDDWKITSYSNNTNAGTASVTITAEDDGNYYGTKTVNFTINKAPLTVTAVSESVLTGETPLYEYEITGFVNGENASVISGAASITSPYVPGTSPAGNYVITAAVGSLSAANYHFVTFADGELSVGITPQTITLRTSDNKTVPSGSASYIFGTTETVSAVAEGGGAGATGAVTYASSDSTVVSVNSSTGELTFNKAGTATITATKAGCVNFAVATASVSISVTQKSVSDASVNIVVAPIPYTGHTHSITDAAVVTDSVTSATLTEGVDYVIEHVYSEIKNAGDYTLTIKGIGNYSGTVNTTLTVNKAVLYVKADNETIAFGEAEPAYTQLIQGYLGTDGISDVSGAATFSAGYTAGVSGAGTYDITPNLSGMSAANYTFAADIPKGVLTVEAKPLTGGNAADVTVVSSHVYSGLTQTPAVVVKDGSTTLTEGTDYDIAYSGDQKSAGIQNFTITYKGNYSGSQADSFTIAKKTLNITADDKTVIYGNSAPAFTGTVNTSDFVSGESVGNLSGSLSYSCDYTPGNNAGSTHDITPGGYTSSNYDIVYHKGTLTVEQKDISGAVITPVLPKPVYDGTPKTTDFTVEDGGHLLVKDTDYTLAGFSNNTSAGTGAVITINGTGNYKGTASGNFEITASGASLVNPTASSIVYGNPLSSAALSGGAGSGGGSWAWVSGSSTYPTVTNSGYSAVYTPSASALANYDWTGVAGWNGGTQTVTRTIPVTVTPAPLTITADDKTTEYGTAALPAYTYSAATFRLSDTTAVLSGGTVACSYSFGNGAGTYNIIASGFTADNYSISYVMGTLTVTKRNISNASIAAIPNKTYTGSPITLTTAELNTYITDIVSATDLIQTPRDFTVSYSNNTNAGTATVTITPTGTGNYTGTARTFTFTIDKANPPGGSYTVPAGLTAVYGNTLASVTLPAGWNWDDTTPGLRVGGAGTRSHSATFTPVDSANYNTVTQTLSITVSPKPLTITGVTATDRPYDGTVNVMLTSGTLQVVETADIGQVWYIGGGTVANADAADGKAVTTSLTLTGPQASNYTLTQPAGITVNITKKNLTLSVTDISGKTFTPLPGTNSGNDYGTNNGFNRMTGITISLSAFVTGETAASTGAAVTVSSGFTLTGGTNGVGAGQTLTLDNTVQFPSVNNTVTFTVTAGNYTGTASFGNVTVYDGQSSGGYNAARAIPIVAANAVLFNTFATTENVGGTQSYDRNYKLIDNITLAGSNNWKPIQKFQGTFDGQGYTFSNMSITMGTAYDAGMFGSIWGGGVVRNLGLININVTGTGDNYGGIAGYHAGLIANCYVTGTISGRNNVGGITGDITTSGTIRNCVSLLTEVNGSGTGSTGVMRVVGKDGGILNENYAFGGTKINGVVVPDSHAEAVHNRRHGETLSESNLDTTPGVNDNLKVFEPDDTSDPIKPDNRPDIEDYIPKAAQTPSVTWPSGLTAVYGQQLSVISLSSGSANVGATPVPGTFEWVHPTNFVGSVGTQTHQMRFRPTDSVSYNIVTAEVTITVTKANPVVTWPTGLTASTGQILSNISLPGNGTSTPAGTFSFTTPSASVGAIGANTHSMTFTPTDNHNYNTLTSTVTVTVSAAPVIGEDDPYETVEGDGSEYAPFMVRNRYELEIMGKGNAGTAAPYNTWTTFQHYKLIKDIYLEEPWTPIAGFAGEFDGNGYTIYDMEIDTTATGEVGMFSTL